MMSGTEYKKYIAQDLGRAALKGIVTRNAIRDGDVDLCVMGTVIQEVRTSNLARECLLGAGLSDKIPAHTVTMACISANQAAAQGAMAIMSGQADAVLVGGAETMSDVPIRFSKPMRQKLIAASKYKKPADFLKFFEGFNLGMLAPEAPAIAEFSSGEVMGHSSDRLAARFGVTREDQDKYAVRSHSLAAKAHEDGMLVDEIFPMDGHRVDNGIRGDSTYEKLSTLRPAFVRPHGTHTAANSSYLTDGASAAFLAGEDTAKERGYTPRAYIKDWAFVSQDPKEELLLGPAYATTRLMAKHGLKKEDIDVYEIHEAFAGQVLANLTAIASDKFATEQAGVSAAIGELPMDRINLWGGSLSIGHPFGATGTRIITTAVNRLHKEDGNLALLTACAAGGQAVAMLIERA
jgi:acetyl-CoA acyltransferase